MYNSAYNYYNFPKQKISSKEKNDEWAKQCIDSASALIFSKNERIRQTMYNKRINYNLANDILDEDEINRMFNPFGIKYGDFPTSTHNYNKLMSKIDLLVGEESKRNFDWKIVGTNSDSFNAFMEKKAEMLFNICMEELQNANFDENKVKDRITKLNKYLNYDYQDLQELVASKLLEYIFLEQKLKYKFNEGFKDLLICGEELYRIDIVSNNVIITRVNPLNLFTIRNGASNKLDDAEVIVEMGYYPVGRVVDEFYEYLTPKNIEELEDTLNNSTSGNFTNYGSTSPVWALPDVTTSTDNSPYQTNSMGTDYYSAFYNQQGECRVVRVRWKSRRKVYKLTYFDETGIQQEKIVSEFYKPNKNLGETTKELWINEWWEGTKIAGGIYVKMQPRPVQIRNINNAAICHSGYVGNYYNINDNKVMSLMDRMKPFQYLYNLMWKKLELVLGRYNGAIVTLNLAAKPNNWDTEKWLYYMQAMGLLVQDPFNEGLSGVAQGKLAGNYNTFNPQVLDNQVGNYIQSMIQILSFIEKQIGDISGITQEREGSVQNVDTLGGVERSVTQSSHITEPYFMCHEELKLRVLQVTLEALKIAFKGSKKVKIQYILDDLGRQVIEFDAEDFASSEFGLNFTSGNKVTELQQLYKQLAQSMIQNDKISISAIMDIYNDPSLASIRRKIESSEENKSNEIQQQQQAQFKAQQDQIAQQQQFEVTEREKDRELEREKIQMDYEIALLNLEHQKEERDYNNDGIEDDKNYELNKEKLNKDVELKRKKLENDRDLKLKQLEETKRINKIKEQQKEKEIAIKNKIANKPKTTK